MKPKTNYIPMKENSLHKKILALQQDFVATKTESNDFGGYKYRNIEKMLSSLKPLLKKHELIIGFDDEVVLRGERYYIKATVTITDGDQSVSGTAYAREELEKKKSDASQLTGSASTYARKYALQGLLGVDDGSNDPDSKDNDRKHYTRSKPKEDLATDKQRDMISVKLGDIGYTTNEQIQQYLADNYGISGKLLKEDASMVISDLIGGQDED